MATRKKTTPEPKIKKILTQEYVYADAGIKAVLVREGKSDYDFVTIAGGTKVAQIVDGEFNTSYPHDLQDVAELVQFMINDGEF